MFNVKYKYLEDAAEPAPAGAEDLEVTGNEGGATVLDGGADPAPGPATWPDNWRDLAAGGDESKLAQLSRYSSPQAVVDAMIAGKERIRSGDLKSPFPQDGSDEEKANWRADNGLPDSPDKYGLDFDSGLVIGEEDKEFVGDFLKVAHETNQTPEQVKQSLEWYYDNKAKQQEAIKERDDTIARETTDKLRAEWGQEYRPHINAIQSFLDTMPADIKDNFASARMSDGTPVLSNPEMLQWLLNQSLEINPATTLVPGSGADVSGSISDELADIQKMMGDRNSDYWKGPKSEKLQARYRQLTEAQTKMAAKG